MKQSILCLQKIFIIIALMSMGFITPVVGIFDTNNGYVIKDGDYLVYDVTVGSFVTNNLSIVDVGAKSIYDSSTPIVTQLRLEFQKSDSQETNFTVTISFSMAGEGYLYYNSSIQGVISFNNTKHVQLRGTTFSNRFYYLNGTEWGYLPFILGEEDSSNITISGSTRYTNEQVIVKEDGTTIVDFTQGSQDALVLRCINNPTAFGFDDNLKLIPTYAIDSDKGILLRSSVNDPFWTIFGREFVLFDGNMILSSTNIDLGVASLGSIILGMLSNTMFLLLPLTILGAGVGTFLLLKRNRRIKRNKRKKRFPRNNHPKTRR